MTPWLRLLAFELWHNILYYLTMQTGAANKKTISFRLEAEKVAALDELAKVQTRDRTFLLSQAVDAYLDVQRWQIEHIKEGLRQADSGMGADHEEVRAKWRRRRR
ncbi:MAG: CopG family transcriptional regulator [Terriglobia bacterium]